jgi:hypothetical protein
MPYHALALGFRLLLHPVTLKAICLLLNLTFPGLCNHSMPWTPRPVSIHSLYMPVPQLFIAETWQLHLYSWTQISSSFMPVNPWHWLYCHFECLMSSLLLRAHLYPASPCYHGNMHDSAWCAVQTSPNEEKETDRLKQPSCSCCRQRQLGPLWTPIVLIRIGFDRWVCMKSILPWNGWCCHSSIIDSINEDKFCILKDKFLKYEDRKEKK